MADALTRRSATESDREFLFQLLKLALGPHIEAVYGPWDESWQRRHFERTTDVFSHIVLELDSASIGCLFVEEDDSSLLLHRILLLPEFQNQGLGSAVVSEILEAARRSRRSVRLQVFRGNPARRLYQRLGFSVVGESDTHVMMEYAA